MLFNKDLLGRLHAYFKNYLNTVADAAEWNLSSNNNKQKEDLCQHKKWRKCRSLRKCCGKMVWMSPMSRFSHSWKLSLSCYNKVCKIYLTFFWSEQPERDKHTQDLFCAKTSWAWYLTLITSALLNPPTSVITTVKVSHNFFFIVQHPRHLDCELENKFNPSLNSELTLPQPTIKSEIFNDFFYWIF